jgi:hypothetical protein
MNATATSAAAMLACLAWSAPALAGETTNDATIVGLDDLATRIGAANLPDGAGVVVAQVEVPFTPPNYAPNELLAEFAGKSLIEMSGASGASAHATLVANNFFGNTISIAPGIT